MLYKSASDWNDAPQKRVLVFGNSGLGKTHLALILAKSGLWAHDNVDYRIGALNLAAEIDANHALTGHGAASDITVTDLGPLSRYLGKPGDPGRGGTEISEYQRRQDQHRTAEIDALMDVPHIAKQMSTPDCPHVICDTGGSICEVVDPENPDDPVMNAISDAALLVWIKGSDDHLQTLIDRFDRAPKPMYYRPAFLSASWSSYLDQNNMAPEDVDPDAFVRWMYARALKARLPRYAGMAEHWGVTIAAEDVSDVRNADDFVALIGRAIDARQSELRIQPHAARGFRHDALTRSLNRDAQTVVDAVRM